MQLILGGTAISFAVVEIEENIFKFTVISKFVGLFVYKLNSFECSAFKVFFHLWNEQGIIFARKSSLADRGPVFDWQEVKSKKSAKKLSHSGQKIFKRILQDLPVPARKDKPSVFSHLDFRSVPDSHLAFKSANSTGKAWVPRVQKNLSGSFKTDEPGINVSLSLGGQSGSFQTEKRSFAQPVTLGSSPVLTGANSIPIGPKRQPQSLPRRLLVGPCTWCFSSRDSKNTCSGRIRCSSCFRPGHVADYCRFPPRFPGLLKNPIFSNQVDNKFLNVV